MSETSEKQAKDLVFGFDVSGSSIRMQGYAERAGGHLAKIGGLKEVKIQKGFDNIISALDSMIRDFIKAERQGINPTNIQIGLGMPARFEKPDGTFPYYEESSCTVQQQVSGIHLGGDCPGKDWKKALEAKLSDVCDHCDVSLFNDAGAQLRTMLNKLREHEPEHFERLLGKTVIYMGPGSGFGASVADISEDGNIRIRHNAHTYDLMVEISPEQRKNLMQLFEDEPGYEVKIVHADDLIEKFEKLPQEHQTYGDLFPLEENGTKNLYLIEKDQKYFIQPVRYFAGKDGIEQLLGAEIAQGLNLQELGKLEPKEMLEKHPSAHKKLSLLGNFMGNYIVELANGRLERLQLHRGVTPMPYDKTGKGLAGLGGVFLGGGAMRDGIGSTLGQGIRKVTQHYSYTSPERVDYNRPCELNGTRHLIPTHEDICLTAAQEAHKEQQVTMSDLMLGVAEQDLRVTLPSDIFNQAQTNGSLRRGAPDESDVDDIYLVSNENAVMRSLKV